MKKIVIYGLLFGTALAIAFYAHTHWGLKTYVNERLGFLIKIPRSAQVIENQDLSQVTIVPEGTERDFDSKGWKLNIGQIKSNQDLQAFTQQFFDTSLCVLGPDQTYDSMRDGSKVYNIRMHETPKAIGGATCDDSDYIIRYSPKYGKIVYWSIGQYPIFGIDDQKMISSFYFIN